MFENVVGKFKEWKFRFNVGLTNYLYDIEIMFDKKNYNKQIDTIKDIYIKYQKYPISINYNLIGEKSREYVERVINAFKHLQYHEIHKNIFAPIFWYIDPL